MIHKRRWFHRAPDDDLFIAMGAKLIAQDIFVRFPADKFDAAGAKVFQVSLQEGLFPAGDIANKPCAMRLGQQQIPGAVDEFTENRNARKRVQEAPE